MTMISYAQNREDVLLDRLFPRGLAGFYLDVGAHDPVHDSVTKHFYDLGWRGVNVEPASKPFKRLEALRRRDVNLNTGISDHEGTLTFYEAPPDIGVSTFSPAQADLHREAGIAMEERTVEVTTLAQVCEQHVDQPIDFLSVDVEGHEREVLAGADWQQWRPRVVLVEATEPGVTVPTHDRWEDVILDAGYHFAAFDGLNRFYVRDEDKGLCAALATPANIFDDYMPYDYSRKIRELAAARVANEALRGTLTILSAHLGRLRSDYRNLEVTTEAIRAQCDEARALAADAHSRSERLRRELVETRLDIAAANELFQTVGPEGLGVARRLSRISARFPAGASVLKRSLRSALTVSRKLRRPSA